MERAAPRGSASRPARMNDMVDIERNGLQVVPGMQARKRIGGSVTVTHVTSCDNAFYKNGRCSSSTPSFWTTHTAFNILFYALNLTILYHTSLTDSSRAGHHRNCLFTRPSLNHVLVAQPPSHTLGSPQLQHEPTHGKPLHSPNHIFTLVFSSPKALLRSLQ